MSFSLVIQQYGWVQPEFWIASQAVSKITMCSQSWPIYVPKNLRNSKNGKKPPDSSSPPKYIITRKEGLLDVWFFFCSQSVPYRFGELDPNVSASCNMHVLCCLCVAYDVHAYVCVFLAYISLQGLFILHVTYAGSSTLPSLHLLGKQRKGPFLACILSQLSQSKKWSQH